MYIFAYFTAYTSTRLAGKITNGDLVIFDKLIHMVSIRESEAGNPKGVHFCSGYRPLVNYVITARVCVERIRQVYNKDSGNVFVAVSTQYQSEPSLLQQIPLLNKFLSPHDPTKTCCILGIQDFEEHNKIHNLYEGTLDVGVLMVSSLKNDI